MADKKDSFAVPEKRLSLDLGLDYHELIEEIAYECGLSNKVDVVRYALHYYFEALSLTREGLEICGVRKEEGGFVKLSDPALSMVLRRRIKASARFGQKGGQASPPEPSGPGV